jgi:2-polyprenyl-6-methoxyphenol hydroxylase-like FAD-dependent oxidoreductase
MSGDRLPVVVVGGGPVGLVLAWRLARAGIPVRVFEREARLEPMLRSSTFHPPTLDMLDEDGIGAALHRAGRITPTWQIRLHETGERAEFDLGAIADATRHPWRLQCDQAVLVETLETWLRALDPTLVTRGAAVRAAGEDADGAWVDWQAGDAPPVRQRAAVVVGCDGARSLVREAIGARFEGTVYPETTVLVTTTFPFEDHLPGLSGINYVWAPDGTYSLLRLADVWRVSLHPHDDETPEDAMQPQRIAQRLAAITPAAAAAPIGEVRPYRVHQRLASHWQRGRLAIAGDAAHLNNPKGGMGMNGGIHDAFELAAAIAGSDGGASPQALQRYERRRLPVVRDDIIGQADQNRARMWEPSLDGRRAMLAGLQAIAADPQRCRAHLLRTSMIDGLRRAATLG